MNFELRGTAPGSRARAAVLTTAHGVIETPIFMPVGTRGSVRTQTLAQLAAIDAPIILANTYHLLVRPGPEVLEQMGGLHRWMRWPRALLTDSGGFQIFSLPNARAMGEDGAEFRSYADGGRLLLTPERSIAMQRAIGSDIMMVLDHCIASTSSHAEAAAAMALTHRWARRSLAARADSPQALFAIVQGACFPDLRRASAAALTAIDGFDGYAIGGLAVGESRTQRQDITELTAELLPPDRPRYLMGVGTPVDLLEAVHRGVDMFDCVLPTAWAQQGVVFTSHGKINLKRGVHRTADRALDRACTCDACALYSRSYLHHLVKCREPLGWQLLAFHNLKFYLDLMRTIRHELAAGTFAAFHAAQRDALAQVDEDNPPARRPLARPPKPSTLGAFAVRSSPAGFASIQHVPSGEVMHSVNDPDVEAQRIYIDQSHAIGAALAGARPLVVWDVGLGAAHNAMALVRALATSPTPAPVTLVSFERDQDAFRLAMKHQKEFPHLRHAAAHLLAQRGTYVTDRLTWTVIEGDFLTTMTTAPTPDVIWYDPFSTKVDSELWSLAAFRQLFAALDRPAELFTYSSSTAVRSALLAAGFTVGAGVASRPQAETTIALRDVTGYPLLGAAWLARRARSTAPVTADVTPGERETVERAITTHPQFASSRGPTAA